MLTGCTAWPDDFAARYRARGYWENTTIGAMLDASIERHRTKEALVFNERRLTYAELGEHIDRLARGLAQCGLKPLDRVVLQLPNTAEFVFAYFALVKIGVIPVMALRAHRHTEIRHFVDAAAAVGHFIPDVIGKFDYRVMAEEVRAQCPALRLIFV